MSDTEDTGKGLSPGLIAEQKRRMDEGVYDNSWWSPGRGWWWQALWKVIGMPIFRCSTDELFSFYWSSRFRGWLLRLFGARTGKNVYIRPTVRITYPWNLEIGDNSSIGDCTWIYNLVPVRIGSRVCVSQNTFLCTGGHDPYDMTMELIAGTIVISDYAWVCADCYINHGVTIGEGTVVGARSVVMKDMPPWKICVGNPCKPVKDRVLRSEEEVFFDNNGGDFRRER